MALESGTTIDSLVATNPVSSDPVGQSDDHHRLIKTVLKTTFAGITGVADEDDMSSDSAAKLATQQSIKAYVDAQVTASDLDFQGDSGGALSIDLDSEALTVAGGTGIDTNGSSNTLTVAIDSTVATLTGSQVLTNKTLTSPVLNTGVSGTAVLDEDDLSSDSATQLATQQSIKAYVDAQVTAQDLDLTSDSGTIAIDLDSESLTVAGGTGIDSSATSNTVTLAIDSTVVTLAGSQTLTNKTLTSPVLNTPTIGTSFTIGSATITEAELEILDGASATTSELNLLSGLTTTTTELNYNDTGAAVGTVVASKVVTADANKDVASFRNITLTGELDAGSLDVSGDADIDGTLEADAITVDGTALNEYIADTIGGMVTGNTESGGITVTYEDGDNTLDFAIGTLNQDTSGTAALATSFTVTANDTANETVYPVFVDGVSGTQGAETDAGLTYNPSTGLLTSTGFSGNLTGTLQTAAQANVTSVGTLTSLTISGDLTVDTNTLKVDSSNNRVGINQASPDVALDMGANTDAVHMPTGTTAQRPGSPAAGYFRYNSETAKFEGYTDEWGSIAGGGSGTNMDTNIFTGDGSDTTFTLSTAPDTEQNLIVFISGVFQAHDAYSVSGTTLTFSEAPANGRVITVFHSTTTVGGSNATINTMTGDNSDVTIELSVAPVHEANTQCYFDGVYQSKSNYSISGTTLTFSTAPPTGVLVEVITLTNTSITTAAQLVDADADTKIQVEESSDEDVIRFDTGGTERMVLTSTGLGIGETAPGSELHVKVSDTGIAPHASAQITLEREGTNYLQFLTAETGTSGILFGDGSDVDVGKITYDHNIPAMQFMTETATAMTIDGSGRVTKPLQPAFNVRNSTSQFNIAIDTDVTVLFQTEIFDVGGNFNNGSSNATINGQTVAPYHFIAPVTGKYQLNTNIRWNQLNTAHDYVICFIKTSNRTYYSIIDPDGFDSIPAYFTQNVSALADMDENDTAYVYVYCAGGSATSDIDSGPGSTTFSGILVA